MPKIIRDIVILFAFCSAFLLLIIFVRGESTKAATSSNFSSDRLEGDRMFEEKNWEQAIVHFTRLVEKDKYNGFAQMSLSKAAVSKLFEEAQEFNEKSKAGGFSRTEAKDIQNLLRAQAIDCIETQKALLRFPKYEYEANSHLAALNCFIDDEDEAMRFIRKILQSGFYHGDSLRFDPRLKSLWERDDFQKLFEAEPDFLRYQRGRRGSGRLW